jgi:hypothetical protein
VIGLKTPTGFRVVTVSRARPNTTVRIGPKPIRTVNGHLRGEPGPIGELRGAITSDEVEMWQAALPSRKLEDLDGSSKHQGTSRYRDGVYSLRATSDGLW